MSVLFTGRGTSGSWRIRGVQLGGELGARVKPRATLKDCNAAGLIVVVKRLDAQLMEAIKLSGRPWVWDIVDFYPQPTCTSWRRLRAVSWVCKVVENCNPKPAAIIWPNERMKKDCAQHMKRLRIAHHVLYHHHRPNSAVNPIRAEFRRLGYEGSPSYITPLTRAISSVCSAFGIEFVINPDSLADCDAVLALRCPETNGYVQRSWKSNVKLANAHGSGTPFIGQRESGYAECATGHELWCTSVDELPHRLEQLRSRELRAEIGAQFLKRAYPLSEAAADMKLILDSL